MSEADVVVRLVREDGCADISLPVFSTAHASGADVHAAVSDPMVIGVGQVVLVPTGFRVACPVGYEIQVRPRSGLALKHGLTVLNSPGTIDADYRGPVGVILANMGSKPLTINRNDRIAQFVVQRVPTVSYELVDSLEETDRGDGGFGSTGV